MFVRDYIARHHEFAAVDDMHQVELMFACRVPDDYAPIIGDTPDPDQVGAAWISIEHARLYPAALKIALTSGARGYLGDIN